MAGRHVATARRPSWSCELAELIVEAMPSMEMVRFVNSGTEATMSAMRLARGFTGRDKIVKFEGCYHGHADASWSRPARAWPPWASRTARACPRRRRPDT